MAKYSDIKGFTVQTVSSAPAASGLAGGSWASGGTANTARRWAAQGSVGTQTATLIIGGGPPTTDAVELYNGSSWTEISELNEANSSQMGIGTSTSALSVGAYTNNESWNGSSWTEINNLNTARTNINAAGTASRGLGFAGNVSPQQQTEDWNGAVWTETSDLNEGRTNNYAGGAGSITSALCSGGQTSTTGTSQSTEEWSGSSTTFKVLTD